MRVRLLAAPYMGGPRRETRAGHPAAQGWQTHFNPDAACPERDLPHINLHQGPGDLPPASGRLSQGFFNQLLLEIIRLAVIGIRINLMIPRSPRRIHLKVISPSVQRRQ
jgi:hypothetical protein